MGDNVIVAKVVLGVIIMIVNFVGGISVGPFQHCLKTRAGAGGRAKLKRFQGGIVLVTGSILFSVVFCEVLPDCMRQLQALEPEQGARLGLVMVGCGVVFMVLSHDVIFVTLSFEFITSSLKAPSRPAGYKPPRPPMLTAPSSSSLTPSGAEIIFLVQSAEEPRASFALDEDDMFSDGEEEEQLAPAIAEREPLKQAENGGSSEVTAPEPSADHVQKQKERAAKLAKGRKELVAILIGVLLESFISGLAVGLQVCVMCMCVSHIL